MRALTLLVALLASAISVAGERSREQWTCQMPTNSGRHARATETEIISIEGRVARRSSDADTNYVVHQNDSEKLIAHLDDFAVDGGFVVVLTIYKKTGVYTRTVNEYVFMGDGVHQSPRVTQGRCVRR